MDQGVFMKKLKFAKFIAAFSAVLVLGISSVAAAGAAVIDDEIAVSSEVEQTVSSSSEAGTDSSLPSKYSSVDLGYVTEIKNQGRSDCWVFAGIEVFESKLLVEGLFTEPLSTNHLNAWATKRTDGKGWQRTLDSDGYCEIAPGYFTSWYGAVEESTAEDIDFDGDVYGDMITSDLSKYGTTSIKYLYKDNPDEIKRSIMKNGGVYTSYAQSASCSYRNSTSYYMPQSYTGSYTGHSIEIVGWDDNYSRQKFGTSSSNKPTNDGAWLVRNSWGNYNSLGGYFWMSYEDKYVFSSKYVPSFTIEDIMEITDDVKLVQNEIYGATYEFSYVHNDIVTYMNKFDFSEDYRTLDKVIFESTCTNADYTIYYVPLNQNEPVADESAWVELYKGKVEYDGYICADIDDFYLPSDSGAIAVKIDSSKIDEGKLFGDEGYENNSLGVGEWLVNSSGYTFINDSKYGDSYIKYDGQLLDLLDWYKINNDDDLGGTFVIKAITDKTDYEVTVLGDVDLDGVVTIEDATLAQKYIAGLESLSEQQQLNGDVDKNGDVDIEDVTIIQKYIANIIEL
jgi:C1A family cysteine protease